MLDSLFLYTFSIPIIISLILFIKYYLEKFENKLLLIILLTALLLLCYDRINDLLDNDERKIIQLILFILLYLVLIYCTLYSYEKYLKYLITMLIVSIILITIESSILIEINMLLLLSTIILAYLFLKNYNSLLIPMLLYILNILIDSPAKEIIV